LSKRSGQRSEFKENILQEDVNYCLLQTLYDLKQEFAGDGPYPLVIVEGQNTIETSDVGAMKKWFGIPEEYVMPIANERANNVLWHIIETAGEYSKVVVLTDPDRAGHERYRSIARRASRKGSFEENGEKDVHTFSFEDGKIGVVFDKTYRQRLRNCGISEVEDLYDYHLVYSSSKMGEIRRYDRENGTDYASLFPDSA
jgi:5S rRNA maturation endonuclease (ribonuclease M5)